MAARRVIVIGGGVVGLCTADALLARDFEVVVIDREPRPGDGCSYGNGGIIVPSHFVPLAAPGMVSLGLRMLPNRQSPFGIDGIPTRTSLAGAFDSGARLGGPTSNGARRYCEI